MPIGAGHAAAPARLNAQFESHSLVDLLPKADTTRLIYFFSAVGKEVKWGSIVDAPCLWKRTDEPLLRQ